jgi:hypothetical protein
MPLAQYLDFLPIGSAFQPLCELTEFFSRREIDFELQLILKREETPGVRLDYEELNDGPMLGWTTWLRSEGLQALVNQHYRPPRHLWELRVLPSPPKAKPRLVKELITTPDGSTPSGVTVAAIWRGNKSINAPAPNLGLEPGDLVIAVGREDAIRQIAGVEVGGDPADTILQMQ